MMARELDFYRNFRYNIRLLREAKELSAAEISLKLGFSQRRIESFEQRHIPKVDELFKLSKFFEVDINDLIHNRVKVIFQ